MNEEEFEECSVVAYPHEIRFLHIKGGRISYCVDRHISDYVNKIQQENKELKKQLEKKYEKVGTLTAEILYEENTRLANEITVLKIENQKLNEQLKIKHNGFMASVEESCELAEENQKLKEMQCTFLGTGCKNKIKEHEIHQKEFIKCLEKEIIDSSTSSGQQYYARQHLKLYKEIIGGKE